MWYGTVHCRVLYVVHVCNEVCIDVCGVVCVLVCDSCSCMLVCTHACAHAHSISSYLRQERSQEEQPSRGDRFSKITTSRRPLRPPSPLVTACPPLACVRPIGQAARPSCFGYCQRSRMHSVSWWWSRGLSRAARFLLPRASECCVRRVAQLSGASMRRRCLRGRSEDSRGERPLAVDAIDQMPGLRAVVPAFVFEEGGVILI